MLQIFLSFEGGIGLIFAFRFFSYAIVFSAMKVAFLEEERGSFSSLLLFNRIGKDWLQVLVKRKAVICSNSIWVHHSIAGLAFGQWDYVKKHKMYHSRKYFAKKGPKLVL